nr:hypothetical protein [Veillonella denticariosi]
MIEALAVLKAAHDALHDDDTTLEGEVCALYKAIVEHMVRGGIRFYKTFPQKQEFMDGLSYIPERFTRFVKAIVDGGDEYVYGANLFNDAIGGHFFGGLALYGIVESAEVQVYRNSSN